ncbi:hypothetical protein F5144DRAFT_182310 [Chaetomium tenue]|uniref:Uncharacterized protein n=1 Tax=Chaetomium tenue TaxID=1854479 RepID=A0ACB7PDX1_9PEZI|nr:hypothetical protein F5144DRAFT_182310 [Chaetomium globosum]
MTRAWRWLATLRPLLVLHAALLRRWKGCLLSFLSGTTPGATPLFETSPSLQIKPLAHDSHTLVTPRLAAFGRVFEIPDAELWRRGGGSESGKSSQAMSAASQPPKWTGRERRTPSPRACYVSSWGNRWRFLAAADCWSLRSDNRHAAVRFW